MLLYCIVSCCYGLFVMVMLYGRVMLQEGGVIFIQF